LLGLLQSRFDDPQARGTAFERLLKAAFEAHPGEYGPLRFKRVWRWSEWPDCELHGFTRKDTGIDLVAEQTLEWGGGLCAIQAKCYEPSARIAKRHVDSFISESSAGCFTKRLLVVTAELGVNAEQTVRNTEPHCEVLYAEQLDEWPVDWAAFLERPEELRFTAQRYTPKPYQSEAVDKVVSGLATNDRGKLILPCGTGKSVVALWIAERMAGASGRVLYLVPSIALMGQTMREWAAQRNPEILHRYIGVCSDTRAGRNDEDADLVELAMPVTTDAQRVAASISQEVDAMTVLFCTYQSLKVIEQAQSMVRDAGGAPDFDLVICDEAHRTTGVHETDAGSSFTLIHDRECITAAKRLYMTATPRVYTDRVHRKVREHSRDFDVYSMDDETVYGPEFYRMSFGDAVEQGHLSDYEVLVIAVSELHVTSLMGSDVLNLPGDETATGGGAQRVTTEEAVKFVGCWDALASPSTRSPHGHTTGAVAASGLSAGRAIAFTNTIKSSQRVEQHWNRIVDTVAVEQSNIAAARDRAAQLIGESEASPAVPPSEVAEPEELLRFDVRHTDGSSNALKRAQILGWLRSGDPDGGCRIVTNAKCLTEGVDVPALDAVLFLEPKRSQIDVVQAVGRVMRLAAGKECGYVVLPVVVPAGLSLDDDKVLSGSDFKVVWSVLKALRSHDERLDVAINTADLTGKVPFRILRPGVSDTDTDTESHADAEIVGQAQGRLPLYDAVASKVVEQCGDRQYWHRWGGEVARITATIAERARTALRSNPRLAEAFEAFEADMAATVGRPLAQADLVSMLAQHVVTVPVFDALFSESGFADRNPMSKALNELLDEFKAADVLLRDETRGLERFYASVADRLSGAADSDTRIKVMLEVYEQFFAAAMPDETKRLGIVYTPVELVDFILRSADAVARAEFGRGLSDAGVNILDPFTGTGTFINRLLTQRGSDGEFLIRDDDLARKFHGEVSGFASSGTTEIHANEVVLLAYYLAALKIEEGFRERTGGYEPFGGIVLTDTFHLGGDGRLPGTGAIADNSGRAKAQNELPIQVIVANPPWSAGQKSAGDDNPNISYPHIEQRVRDTYGKRHKQVTGRAPGGNAAGNLYVEAIRWASDRISNPDGETTRPGIVAFVHPNSLANGTSFVGMRATLRNEFTAIYVINLRGDAMKSGDEFRREGDKIFGAGSRNGVQITVLVRNPAKDLTSPATLRYAEVPEYSTLKQKLDWLAALGDVTSDEFVTIEPNDAHDWVNITDGSFKKLMPVCSTDKSATEAAVGVSARGITTDQDAYVYSFSQTVLITRVSRLIAAYNEALELVEAGCTVEECTRNDELDRIKWTGTLKQSLRRHQEIVFDESRIREVLYRPFTKLWLYEDDRILSSVKTISAMFPKPQLEVEERERERERESSPSNAEQPRSQLTPRHGLHHRSQLSRPQSGWMPSNPPTEAVLVNQTLQLPFGVLATDRLVDLCVTGRQTRCLTRVMK